MKVAVLGCGRWGSFLAWYSNKIGHDVTMWGRENSETYKNLKKTKQNEYLKLGIEVKFTSSLEYVIKSNDIIIISISSQGLRELASNIKNIEGSENKTYVLCMKGLEASSGKRLTKVFKEETSEKHNVAIWVGPGHVQDFTNNIPNCMIIGSDDINVTKKITETFVSDLIRFYYAQDMIGNEIGAATKNVIGIAAGVLDGLNFSSLKGALMSRGTKEISRLVKVMGGNEMTIYGLCHLGDYEATLFSEHSNNRKFGEDFAKGVKFEKLAEGVKTIEALHKLAIEYNVELPICNALYEALYCGKDVKNVLLDLFLRPTKFEI